MNSKILLLLVSLFASVGMQAQTTGLEQTNRSMEEYDISAFCSYSSWHPSQYILDNSWEILRYFRTPAVIGKQKCSDFGKKICSKIGNNGTVFSATRVQYYRQQCCSTSKGSIFLIYSFILCDIFVGLVTIGQLYDAAS